MVNPRKTTQEFISAAKEVHGDKYDYSDTVYLGALLEIEFVCQKHGKQVCVASKHLQSKGCKKCSLERVSAERLAGRNGGKEKKTTEQFIQEAIEVHGDKYNYSQTKYVNSSTSVEVYCNACQKHFLQLPIHHRNGSGCPRCSGKHSYSTPEYIDLVKEVHGEKYDYSLVDYQGKDSSIVVICKKYGNEVYP